MLRDLFPCQLMLEILMFQCYLVLLLANIRILLCFFFFLVIFSNFLAIPVVREKIE